MGNTAAASCLLNQTERIPDYGGTGGQESLLKGAYSEFDPPAVRSIGKRIPDHWSERVSMTAVLFLLLGLWAVIWEAVGLLASAVLR
jgi:hypothetical protein